MSGDPGVLVGGSTCIFSIAIWFAVEETCLIRSSCRLVEAADPPRGDRGGRGLHLFVCRDF